MVMSPRCGNTSAASGPSRGANASSAGVSAGHACGVRRAAAFDEADAHAPVLPAGVKRRAPPARAPGGNGFFHIGPAKPAPRQGGDHLLALPFQIRRLAPVLELAAAAKAKMPAGRGLALGAWGQNLQHLGPIAQHARAHALARQRVGAKRGAGLPSVTSPRAPTAAMASSRSTGPAGMV